MITSTAYTFLWGWEGSTAQVTTALRNPTTRSPWLQATVNPWFGYSGIHSGEGEGEGEWGEVEDSIRALVTGPNPSGVDRYLLFIAA